MKWWILAASALTVVVYFHFMPPPHYVKQSNPLTEDIRHIKFPMVFRTFPNCDIYVYHPQDQETYGKFVGRSNSRILLEPPGGQGTLVYYVYSQRAQEIVQRHATEWNESERSEFPSDNLRRPDMDWDVWPPTYLPKIVLTTPSAWQTFLGATFSDLGQLIRTHWAISTLAGAGLALHSWRRGRERKVARARAASTVVGDYLLQESLGKGGAGEVFRAKDLKGNEVALKMLHASAQDNPELHKRFQSEIKICSKLNHPNIVRLIDWGKQNDILYLVMELLQGESLGSRLRRDKKLSGQEFVAILIPLAEALQSLHELGLVHRDLKPDNIFLRQTRGPALMDFGIAAGDEVTRATQTGAAVGTPSFMAPEQVKGLFEPATDQYALGVLAFVCLTGSRPFEAEDAAAMAYQHTFATPPRPSTLNAELPALADSVILKMLAKNPSQRYPSIREAARALEHALTTHSFLDESTVATSS